MFFNRLLGEEVDPPWRHHYPRGGDGRKGVVPGGDCFLAQTGRCTGKRPGPRALSPTLTTCEAAAWLLIGNGGVLELDSLLGQHLPKPGQSRLDGFPHLSVMGRELDTRLVVLDGEPYLDRPQVRGIETQAGLTETLTAHHREALAQFIAPFGVARALIEGVLGWWSPPAIRPPLGDGWRSRLMREGCGATLLQPGRNSFCNHPWLRSGDTRSLCPLTLCRAAPGKRLRDLRHGLGHLRAKGEAGLRGLQLLLRKDLR